MKNRNEYSPFIQRLDAAAEKSPLLWLPCVTLIALALAWEHIAGSRRGEKAPESPQLGKKPLALRAVAVTLAAAFSLMLVPVTSFADPVEEDYAIEGYAEPEETEIPAVEVGYDNEIMPFAVCAHVFHMWEQTEYQHWWVCAGDCQQEFDRANHDFAITVKNPTRNEEGRKTFTCTVCKYSYYKTLPKVSHEHQYSPYWSRDTDSHWHVCTNTDCEAVGEFAAHNFGDWQYYSGSEHYRQCTVCSYIKTESHDFKWHTDGTGHYEECTGCHAKRNEGEHNFKMDWDTTNHWQECTVCDYTTPTEAHVLSGTDWLYDSNGHWQGCACGYVPTSGSSAAHDLHWDMDDDDGTHWQYCTECDWESDPVAHNLKWTYDDMGEYGQHWQECVCGYETGWDEHDFNDWAYESDDNDHWYECTTCGLKLLIEEHDPEWSYGDDWHKLTCTICDKVLEEGGHAYKLTFDEEEHWAECKCGSAIDYAPHDFESDFTLDEGEGYDPNDEDSEDDRTSVKRFYCTICGYYYNTPITHTHKPGTEWKHNASDHWHECTSCGKPVDKAAHVSDGGVVTLEPTLEAEGIMTYTCTICGYIIKTEPIPALPPIQNDTPPIYYEEPSEVYQRLPYITNAPEIKGWEKIAAHINASPDRVVIPITMNGEEIMPKEIAECIDNRELALRIDMGNVLWTVNGLDVTEPQTVNLRVSSWVGGIPASAMEDFISELTPKEYRLYHNGDLGFKGLLTLNMAKTRNNYYAALFYYNAKTGKLEYVDERLVANRQVTLELTHASLYVIAFNSNPLYDNIAVGAGAFESPVPIETTAMPETGGVTLPAVKLPQIMKYSSRKRRFRILKKRRLDDLVFVL